MIWNIEFDFFISAWKGGVEGRGRLNNTLLFRCWLHALVWVALFLGSVPGLDEAVAAWLMGRFSLQMASCQKGNECSYQSNSCSFKRKLEWTRNCVWKLLWLWFSQKLRKCVSQLWLCYFWFEDSKTSVVAWAYPFYTKWPGLLNTFTEILYWS